MGLWSRLLKWGTSPPAPAEPEAETPAPAEPDANNTVELPLEPFVFECRQCGKVFEARRRRPHCPECDSADVAVMSE